MTDELHDLLALQDIDTALDQLRHRRSSLPARRALTDIASRRQRLDAETAPARAERAELVARQRALEEQITAARERRRQLEARMYGGHVTGARDLQAMDEEVKHLAHHVDQLEDAELEIMEALEPLEGTLQGADVERDALDRDAARLTTELAAAEAELDAELRAASLARDSAASQVPAALLKRYEALRVRLGGTGACHLTLPAVEVDRIRRAPPEAVITCDQCGRILVR
jgi:predicted  nucleic acid-binding Zn-ribbon protein